MLQQWFWALRRGQPYWPDFGWYRICENSCCGFFVLCVSSESTGVGEMIDPDKVAVRYIYHSTSAYPFTSLKPSDIPDLSSHLGLRPSSSLHCLVFSIQLPIRPSYSPLPSFQTWRGSHRRHASRHHSAEVILSMLDLPFPGHSVIESMIGESQQGTAVE